MGLADQLAADDAVFTADVGIFGSRIELPDDLQQALVDAFAYDGPTSNVEITGDASDPVNKIVIQAIADLEKFWGEQFPTVYEKEFEPISGGYYAVNPSTDDPPPCAQDASEVAGNAFYCSTKDVVAWDAEGLLPELQKNFGDFVIPVVMAHEWGHAVQARSNFTARTVTKELQADCFAGAWSKHAKDDGVFDITAADLDTALAGILELRDTPGTIHIDPDAHGSGFDRVSAFQDGFDNGLGKCKDYRDDEPMVVELPFSTEEDAARAGDASYDSIVNGVPYDIEDYFTQVYPVITDGKEWPRCAASSRSTPTARRRAAATQPRASRCSIACQTITSDGTTSRPCRRFMTRAVTTRSRRCWPPSGG